jgi:hypothetical protein
MDLQLDQTLTRDAGKWAPMRFADNEEAFANVCGFIARRHKPKDCSLRYKSIIGDGDENYNAFIILSRGHLTFPSVDLIRLVQEVEVIISDCLKATIKRNTLLEILFKIEQHKIHSLVGCPEREKPLTKAIIMSFLITRMCFSCKKETRKGTAAITKSKRHAKLAKLV